MSFNTKANHYIVPNLSFWSTFVLLLQFITIISTQGSQRFEKSPDGQYHRLRDQSLDIPCHVRGREGECLWLHDGRVISNIADKYQFQRTPNNGDCSLRITHLNHKTDEGKWQCQVTTTSLANPPLISDEAIVVVLVAPSPPLIKNVESNKLKLQSDRNSEIECISQNGNPAARIEWLIDGENITQNSRMTVDSETSDFPKVTSILSHTFKRSHRNSTITCRSVHPTLTQNSSAIIDVLYAPLVSVPQKTYTVDERQALEVECLVDANPPTKAQWRSIDQKVPNYLFETSYQKNKLRIPSVTKDMNKAIFECIASNEFGTSGGEQVALDVLFEPMIMKTSEIEQRIDLGQNLELFCDYLGNPEPKISWFHINPITDQVRNLPKSEDKPNVLLIRNATYDDEGHYYCEVANYNSISNKDKVARSLQIVVDVMGKPAIIQKLDTTYGYRGTETDVEQLFCSDPKPTAVYWTYGSVRIDVKLDSFATAVESNVTKALRHKARQLIPMDKHSSWPTQTCFQAILSIFNTDISDQRDYTLIIENSKGVTQSVVKLKVNSPISAAIMITIGLIVLIMLLALTLVTMLVIKRRKLAKEKADDESKAEARAPMKSDTDKPEKEPEKAGKGDNHELVYANLDFAKPEAKPTKAKPTAQQRQHKTNGGNSGTEYAQITFANKADL